MSIIGTKGTALVTGASSGIGAIYADRLARRGYNLILVARNHGRLQELASKLTTQTDRSAEIITADLSNPTDLSRVEARLRDDSSITLLVNNAGVGAGASLLESDVEKMDDLISLNVTALMRLTYAAAPGFVARGNGTFINISSIVAVAPEVLNGVYGASKAFVLALSQSLQHELGDKGVRVQAVLPGATATEFWDVAGVSLSNLPQEYVMAAADLVDSALKGLDLGEIVTIPALPNQAEWNSFEAARRAMAGRLSSSVPAARYGIAVDRSVAVA